MLATILTPVIRELETNDEQGSTIRLLAEKVRQFYREKTSSVVYDDVIAKIQRKLNIKKTKRKVTRAQTVSSMSKFHLHAFRVHALQSCSHLKRLCNE